MKIIVDHASFARYQRHLDKVARDSVNTAAIATKHAARSVQSPLGYDLSEIRDGIEATPAMPSRRGWAAWVNANHPLSLVFEKGSYAKLGRKMSSRGRARATTGNRGVKPVRYMRTAAKYGRGVLFRELQRRL